MKPLVDSQAIDSAAAAVPVPILRPGLPGAALRLMSDERLARLVAAGDRAAFGVVFTRYQQELYRYCLSVLRDREDAADALQGTMLRALGALEGETRAIALRPWLYRIAHNESIDLLRRRSPRSDAAPELPSGLDCGVEAGAEARARLQQLLTDLRELPERHRGALVMRELGGLDYAQIADALETSPAAAKQAVYEARRTLFELAKGRDLDCDGIRTRLSEGDGRFVRGRAVRAHLRACSTCRDFQAFTTARRSALSSLPAGAAVEILGGSAGAAGVGLKSLAALALVVAAAGGATQALPQRPAQDQPARPAPATHPVHRSAAPAPPQARSHRRRPHHHSSTTRPHSRVQTPPEAAAPREPESSAPVEDRSARGATQPVVPPVQQDVQQAQDAVGQVQQALPVKTPSLPALSLP